MHFTGIKSFLKGNHRQKNISRSINTHTHACTQMNITICCKTRCEYNYTRAFESHIIQPVQRSLYDKRSCDGKIMYCKMYYMRTDLTFGTIKLFRGGCYITLQFLFESDNRVLYMRAWVNIRHLCRCAVSGHRVFYLPT